MKKKWIASQAAMAFAMAAMTVLLAAGCDDGMTGAVAAVVAGQQNGTGSNHAPSMPDGEIDDDGVLTKYTGNETDVTIPEGVTDIGSGAFRDCTSLESVKIPASVTSIGKYAFWNCTSLTGVDIPASVTSIGGGAFYECESLETVTYNGTLAQWCAMDNDYNLMGKAERVILTGENNMNLKQVDTLKIPDGVERIGIHAFYDCTALTDVTIPASVTSIEGGAFYGCESLETVTYNGTLAQWCAMDNDFWLMHNATSVILTGQNNMNLKQEATLVIPDEATKIGRNAFGGCTSLTGVTIPEGVTSIGYNAFYECTSLASVNISDGVTSIEDSTFCMCKKLNNVTIPDSVKSIGEYAFRYCYDLTSVTYGGTKEQWASMEKGASIFYGTNVTKITDKDDNTFAVDTDGNITD